MEKRPYSDRRWQEAPKAYDSECNMCTCYHGYAKCDKYPDGIPSKILDQSFRGMDDYKEGYCKELQKKA